MAEILRGFLLDSARCLENRAYYRRFIKHAAAQGMNAIIWHFTDDQGCTLKFDAAPEAAGPHAYSKTEMKSLVRFARRHGITLIPELESLGHSRYLTSHPRFRPLLETEEEFTAICPVAPETRAIMSALLHEVAEVFDSPYIHVGLDEVRLGGHPLTQAALEKMTERELFADYVNFLHREVTALGRRMIIWGDHRTRKMNFLPLVPRDIIIADWEYTRTVDPAQIEHFLSLGFDVLLCAALITYDQPFLAGTQLGLSNVQSMSAHQHLPATAGKIVGLITTIWTPTRYLHDAQWHVISVAADVMHDPSANVATSTEKFLREFHGFVDSSPDLRDAFLHLLDHAPLREPYLSLLRAQTTDVSADDLRAWQNVVATLRAHRTSIRTNRRAYDTLILAARFITFLYQRALAPAKSANSARMFLQRLSRQWDRERFSDDPRKSSTRFTFDRAEHLLLSFGDSLSTGTK